MTDIASADPARHQSGGLAVALAKLNLDALTVADAVADVASTAGENVTTAIRADLKELPGRHERPDRYPRWCDQRPDRHPRRLGPVSPARDQHAPLDDRGRLHPVERLPRPLDVPAGWPTRALAPVAGYGVALAWRAHGDPPLQPSEFF